MADKHASRFVWALELLDIRPDARVLEIGCGHGVAVSMVGARLRDGRIVAIDRSYDMVDLARQRNQALLKSGRAEIHAASLDRADFGGAHFDLVFAINVGLFEQQADRGLEIIRTVIAPGGRLFVIYQPPNSARTREIAARTVSNLEANGFVVDRVSFKDIDPATATCIEATVATG